VTATSPPYPTPKSFERSGVLLGFARVRERDPDGRTVPRESPPPPHVRPREPLPRQYRISTSNTKSMRKPCINRKLSPWLENRTYRPEGEDANCSKCPSVEQVISHAKLHHARLDREKQAVHDQDGADGEGSD
jgi:hypothetical protein